MTKATTDMELQQARELCAALGECTATYYLVLLLNEVERLGQQQPAERLKSRLLGLCDGFDAARGEVTEGDVDEALKVFSEAMQTGGIRTALRKVMEAGPCPKRGVR